MKNKITNKEVNDLLELIGHFILTKPILAKNLLSKHGIKFSFNPSKIDLSNEYVELLSSNNDAFNKELTHLLNQHIEAKNDEIREIASQDEDEFWGAIAKLGLGIVKGVGGKLFGKKKKSSGGGGANLAAQMQMQQKMAQIEADRRRSEEDERRRRREEDDRRKRDEANKQKAGQSKMMMMGIGLIALLGIGAFVMKSKAAPVK